MIVPADPNRMPRVRSTSAFTLLEALVVLVVLVATTGVVILATESISEAAPQQTTSATLTEVRKTILSRYYADVGALPQSMADLLRRRVLFPPEVPDLTGSPYADPALGWRGPYMLHSGATYAADPSRNFVSEYGPITPLVTSAPALLDGWANPVVLQIPNSVLDEDPAGSGSYVLKSYMEDPPGSGLYVKVPLRESDVRHSRVISAGPNGVVDTPRLDVDTLGPVPPTPAQKAWFPPRSQCGDDLVLYIQVTDQRQ